MYQYKKNELCMYVVGITEIYQENIYIKESRRGRMLLVREEMIRYTFINTL